ncbi:unnamed protein product [Boreogadus saida]
MVVPQLALLSKRSHQKRGAGKIGIANCWECLRQYWKKTLMLPFTSRVDSELQSYLLEPALHMSHWYTGGATSPVLSAWPSLLGNICQCLALASTASTCFLLLDT